jgi:hypothetical protein
MKLTAMFSILAALAIAIGAAHRRAAGDPPAAEKDTPAPVVETPSAAQASPLDELAWMVGRWVDQGSDSTVRTNCSWTQDHKFLTQSFSITMDGKVGLEGEQKIGWDPIEKRIRSWIFDSKGGFGEGSWIKDGNRWSVKTSFVLAGGERASAINEYTVVNADTYCWQSVDREIGGELQPNIPEVTVVRQEPETKSKPSETESPK